MGAERFDELMHAGEGAARDRHWALSLSMNDTHWRVIVRIVIATLLVTALAAWWAAIPLQPVAGYFPALAVTTATALLLTAHLFLAESRRLGSIALGSIGVTYLAVGWLTLASFFTFPGNVTVDSRPWQSEATGWLGVFRFISLPLGLALYGAARRMDLAGNALTSRAQLLVAGTWPTLALNAACAVVAAAIAVGGATIAPNLFPDGQIAASFRPFWAAVVVGAAAVCWQLYRRVTTAPNLLDAWLCVVALAWTCAALLIMLGGSRYSLGWYVARADGLVAGAAVLVGMFLELVRSRQSETVARRKAQYDDLTGLPNRALLAERLGRALRDGADRGTFVAILFIDLDLFKLVNDTHGHAVGDEVLQITGKRLASCVRDSDTVARLGGDEFIVVLGGLRAAGDHAAVTEKLRASVALRYSVQHRDIVLSASIGVSVSPTDSQDPAELLRFADAALYQAKSLGRNAVVVYNSSSSGAATERAPDPAKREADTSA